MRSAFSFNKRDELLMDIIGEKYDIVGLTETWATNSISDSELDIAGYSVYRRDRNNILKSKGGGVALYIKDNLVSSRYDLLPNKECEGVYARISLGKNSHLLVEVCCRSPNASIEESLELFKMVSAATDSNALIFGDFNYPNIDWINLDVNSGSRHFLDILNDSYLTQHVTRPTRGSNILYLVLTTESDMISEFEVPEHLANCDHNILAWEIDCNAPVVLIINKSSYVFHKGNYKGFRSYLAGISMEGFVE